jgi:probable phosphoglycerate mutase
MTLVAFLRHAPTAWNAAKRIQGHTDEPLSDAGRAWARQHRLPAELRDWPVFSSPLLRAMETARLVGGSPRPEPRLIEMNWGAAEGRTLADLRADPALAFAAAEDGGLDFRAPGGESPRDVQNRVGLWLAGLDRPSVAVSHKGVIRAVMAAAEGWPMIGKAPVRLDWSCLQVFRVQPGGKVVPERYNLPLEQAGLP